ncbi:MAG: trehalose-6-phosphate synthase [Oricola sp.]
MSRLVVVSNRVADLRKSAQSGGLAVALADAMKKRGGLWFGWDGKTGDMKGPGEPVIDDIGRVRTISVPLSRHDLENYYEGYANSVLWPLFHYRPDIVAYDSGYSHAYHAVNERFARLLAPHLRDDDIVWVHDYHLIPLAHYMRRIGCRQRIGYFLHIPFPPHELLAASPEHAELVETLLAYDVVGFQSSVDVANMRNYLEHRMNLGCGDDGFVINADGRTTFIGGFPISIDAGEFARMAEATPDDVEFDMMWNRVLQRKQVIGVDRLDYSKGIPNRVQAMAKMLEDHPELERRVSLLQIAQPTRENVDAYADIRAELEGLTGAVNGRFSDFNWTPIRYMSRAVPRDKLATLYRASHVGFVTPLRDGMNLVAKEFVAAQDPDDPGVLVLSQFAGAAEELTEALIVNPYDIDDMAVKLYDALILPLDERKARHESLFRRIARNDTEAWLKSFISRLESAQDGRAAA